MKIIYFSLGTLVANLTDAKVAENFFLNLGKTWNWNLATHYLVPVKTEGQVFQYMIQICQHIYF